MYCLLWSTVPRQVRPRRAVELVKQRLEGMCGMAFTSDGVLVERTHRQVKGEV